MVTLQGIRLHAVTQTQAVAHVIAELDRGRGGWVITPNLDHLRRARSDAEFRGWLGAADLVVADGMPLIWASRLKGQPLPERVPGSDLVLSVAEAAAGRGRSIFLLGGAPGAAEGAAKALRERFPGLPIAGQFCPSFGFENDLEEQRRIREMLITAAPDVVYVALGSPKQERLIAALRPLLPRTWWFGIGISLSFLAGQVERAPQWMQKAGLEWTHRLVQEPGRLAKRYLVQGVPFAVLLLVSAAFDRFAEGEKTMNKEAGRA